MKSFSCVLLQVLIGLAIGCYLVLVTMNYSLPFFAKAKEQVAAESIYYEERMELFDEYE